MADQTKLVLSDGELHFVQDTGWVLTKQKIIQTVCELLNLQVPVISGIFEPLLTGDMALVKKAVPKISKGENYQSLPYVILDYPALFNKESIFALRTMFWWGKSMSITLQLGDSFADKLRERIVDKLFSDPGQILLCVNSSPWEHHWEETNYRLAASLTKEELLDYSRRNFIKLALKYDLKEWHHLPALLGEGYKKIAKLF